MIKTDDYNDSTIDRIKTWMQSSAEQNQPKFFEVILDGMKFINRTSNFEMLDNIDTLMDEKTKIIRILVYNTEASHRAQIFELRTPYYHSLIEQEKKEKELSYQKTLQGIPTQEEISKQINSQVSIIVQQEKEKAEQQATIKELNELRGVVKEDKQYIKKLESKVEELESKKLQLTPDGIINVGSGILGKLMETNPQIMETVSGLAGIVIPKNKSNGFEVGEVREVTNDDENLNGTEEPTVTFKKCKSDDSSNEEEEEEDEFDEETQAKLDLFETAETNLNDEQYQKYFEIAKFLAHKTHLVETVYDLLKSESERMKKVA